MIDPPTAPRRWRAAVIGAGMIGCRMDRPGVAAPQTHVGGFAANPRFDLCAIVDDNPDILAAAKAAGWRARFYQDPWAMLEAERPEVVSLALSTAPRVDLLARLADLPLRAVVTEKPLALDPETGAELVERFATVGIPLLVNLSRRYVPLYGVLADRFSRENVLSASIRYAKGVRHNGVHAIDLAMRLFGSVKRMAPLAWRCDAAGDDPTVSAFLELDRCPQLFLQGLDDRHFTLFELDVITTQGRYVVDRDHRRLRSWTVQDGAGIPPGRRLVEAADMDTGHEMAMTGLIDDVLKVLECEAPPLCPASLALEAERLCAALAAGARDVTGS